MIANPMFPNHKFRSYQIRSTFEIDQTDQTEEGEEGNSGKKPQEVFALGVNFSGLPSTNLVSTSSGSF